jgi:hypothetical protein
MASSAVNANQSALQLGNGASPQVFTTIADGVSISGLGVKNDLIEVTNFQSTAKEYIGGLSDGQEVTFTANYIPNNSQHVALKSAVDARSTKDFRLVLPSTVTPRTFSFSAVCLGWNMTLGPNAALQIEFTVKVSGSILGPN